MWFKLRGQVVRICAPVFILVSLIHPAPCAHAGSPPIPVAHTDAGMEALALHWFADMRAGKINRSELSQGYSGQLTPDTVQAMSRYLREYQYGAPPTSTRVLLRRATGNQTFYAVKLVFPRGDAASLMFGFDAQGKITGISLMSMAGD